MPDTHYTVQSVNCIIYNTNVYDTMSTYMPCSLTLKPDTGRRLISNILPQFLEVHKLKIFITLQPLLELVHLVCQGKSTVRQRLRLSVCI